MVQKGIGMADKKRTLGFIIISSENDGLRFDRWSGESYVERLQVAGAKTDRLNTFFKDHDRSVDSAIGRCHNIHVERGELKADVTFGADDHSVLNKYQEGILRDVSVGYSIHDYEVEERDAQPNIVTVTDFSIIELSCVGVGFDRGAQKIAREHGDGNISDQQLRDMNKQLDRIAEKLNK